MRVDLLAYNTGIDLPQPNLNVHSTPDDVKVEVNVANPVDNVNIDVDCECGVINVNTTVPDYIANVRLTLAQGLQGPTGEQGSPGLSFYEEAVTKGVFTGTYEEFIHKYIPQLVAKNVDPNTIPATMTWSNSNW